MFLDFYNLREQPFGVTPDPRYLYLSSTHREALASLLYGVQCGRGFMTLIARPGMGKTTLLYCLLERLSESARTAFLFQTQSTPAELFRQLVADLGLGDDLHDMVAMHQRLNQFLVRQAENRRQVVVVIDEAQNLSDEVLESVRLLSNFETPQAKLIQIILAGQPPLADKLARPSLSQLCQRLSIMAHLDPFNRTDTDHYIDHRLEIAGHSGDMLFTPEARTLIALLSKGIPRRINHLCFNALSIGCALRKATIDCTVVREAAADLDIAALGTEGAETPAPRHIGWNAFPSSSRGSEGPENHGAQPGCPTTESKPPLLQPSPGGSRPQAVPEVLPGMVSQLKGNGSPRWALRAAIFCAVLIGFSLVPLRVADLYNPPAPPVSAAPAARESHPVIPVSMPVAAEPAAQADISAPEAGDPGVPQAPPLAQPHKSVQAAATRSPRLRPRPSLKAEGSVFNLHTNPPGAAVNIDGKSYGQTPVEAVLSPGSHTYRVELAGYPPYQKTLDLLPGVMTNKTLTFGASSGTLDIWTIPPGAQISVDGVVRGSTPSNLQIEAGNHELEISLAGYRTLRESIEAPPGQKVQVYRDLSPQ